MDQIAEEESDRKETPVGRLLGALLGRRPGIVSRAMRYAVSGTLGTGLYFGLVVLQIEIFAWDPVWSAVASFVVTTLVVYVANRGWVFETTRSHASALPRFIALAIAGVFLNGGIMHLTVNVLGWWYVFALLIATFIVPPTNFLLNYYWCFR